ncbi:MAG: hypothetical protein MI824_01945, partial [Hyphomicrobiales bacterium]|nr:hypothetical protein [Hyphomicrobiales bacterium]
VGSGRAIHGESAISPQRCPGFRERVDLHGRCSLGFRPGSCARTAIREASYGVIPAQAHYRPGFE